MAQDQVALHVRTPQVDVAVSQPDVLADREILLHQERRRARRVQDVDLLRRDFDLARRQLGVDRIVVTANYGTFNRDDEFATQQPGAGVDVGPLLVEHYLGHARAVPQVDEDQAAQIPPPMDPTHQNDALANIARTQIAAAMGSFEATEEIQRDGGLTCGVHQRSCDSCLYVRLSST